MTSCAYSQAIDQTGPVQREEDSSQDIEKKAAWVIRGLVATHLIKIKVKSESQEKNGINTKIVIYKKYNRYTYFLFFCIFLKKKNNKTKTFYT